MTASGFLLVNYLATTWPIHFVQCAVNYNIPFLLYGQEGEGNILFTVTLNTFYLWRQTYGKGPLIQLETKSHAATSWTTLSD